jgi:hypothetical protein
MRAGADVDVGRSTIPMLAHESYGVLACSPRNLVATPADCLFAFPGSRGEAAAVCGVQSAEWCAFSDHSPVVSTFED